MNRTEFLNILKEHNVVFHKNGSRHDIYIHTISGKKVTIPRHREMKNKFLKMILDEIQQTNDYRTKSRP
jgi:hypothetical protein